MKIMLAYTLKEKICKTRRPSHLSWSFKKHYLSSVYYKPLYNFITSNIKFEDQLSLNLAGICIWCAHVMPLGMLRIRVQGCKSIM